jgi:hypothetical protein
MNIWRGYLQIVFLEVPYLDSSGRNGIPVRRQDNNK